MTEQTIIDALEARFTAGYKYWIRNAYIYGTDWESDFFNISRLGYANEFEVKISRSDFFSDFKKRRHEVLSTGGWMKQTTYDRANDKWNTEFMSCRFKPNRIFYVVPKGLVRASEVPAYAGLIYVGAEIEIVKPAPLIHKEKIQYEDRLCTKYFNRMLKLEIAIQRMKREAKYNLFTSKISPV